MKKQSTYSGWKFGNVVTADDGSTHPVWLINEGSTYPFLYATASKITIQEQSADFMDYGSTDYVYQLNLTGIDTLDLDKIEVVAAWIGDDYNYNNSTSTKLKYDSSSRSISVPKLNLEPGSHYYTVTVSCPGYIAGTATVTVKINIQIKNPQLENATAGTEWQYTVDVGSNYTNKVAISSWDVYNSSGISIKNSDPIIEKTGNLKFVGHFSSLSTAAVYYLQYTISGEGYGSDTSPRIQIVVAEPAVEKPSFSRIEVGRNSGDNSFIFTCIGPQNVAEYIWVFDDGQRGDSRQNISRDFTVPGDHYVDLTVKNSNGDTYGPIRSETFVASDNRQGYAILGEEYETDKYDVSGLNGMSYTLDANWPSDVTLTRHYENGKGWYTATVPDKAEYNNIQSRLTLWFDEVKWYVDVVFMYRTVVDDSSIKFDYEFLGNGVVKFSFPSSIQYTTSASIAEFRNTLAGNPSWDFGDGTKSSGFEIDSKKYSTPGTKSVTITYAFKSERTTAHSYTATITVPEFDNGGDEPSQTHITNEWLNNLDTVWKAKPNESFGIIVDTTGIKNVTIRSDSDVFQYVYGAIIGEPKEVGTYNITIEITLNDGSNTVESKTIQIVVEEENDYQQIIQVAVILAVIGIVGVLAITRFT